MASTLPASRPQMTKEQLLAKIAAAHPDFKLPEFLIVGMRGYYLDTMGVKGKNDRKIYDDAIFLVGKSDFAAFNGNTDPAAFKLSIASLKPGIWTVYKFDKHKGKTTAAYPAICQRSGNVTVVRDGDGKTTPVEEKGNFGINIHMGGSFSTASLGCQTIPPAQWKEFMEKANAMAKAAHGEKYAEKVYTYILLENTPPAAVK